MVKKQIIKNIEKAVLFGLVFSVIVSFSKFNASCDNMRKNILRLHIIANSDSESDQEVKLKVRDAILKLGEGLFADCNNLKIAEKTAIENINNFENVANKVLTENGFTYSSSACCGICFFNTREYESFTLPAGYYNSLNITLGNGKGKNFWCVIYPSVCIASSGEKLEKSIDKKSSYIAEHPQKYKMRFKAVEVYEKIKKKRK